MPGPSKKPTYRKKLEGTFNKSLALDNEFTVPVTNDLPPVPKHYNKDQETYFVWLCKTLIEVKILSNTDVHMVGLWACAMALHKKAIEKLNVEGEVITSKNGYKQPNPYLAMMRDSEKTIERISNLFGLNPSARTKIPMPDVKNEGNEIMEIVKEVRQLQ